MRIKFLVVAAILLGSLSMQAQSSFKLGWTNIDYLLQNMPEAKEIQAKLQTESAQYEKLLSEKYADYQKQFEDYQKNQATMSSVIKADKEKSLMNKQNEIEELNKNSQAQIQAKQQELVDPVMTKIQKAIDDVAKENGYTYIINSDAGMGTNAVILVAPESDNISALVFKKLGVTPPPADKK